MNDALWTLAAILVVAAVHVVRAAFAASHLQEQTTLAPRGHVHDYRTTEPPADLSLLAPPRSSTAAPTNEPGLGGLLLIDPTGHCVYHDRHIALRCRNASPSLDEILEGGPPEASTVMQALHHDGKLERYTTQVAGAMPVALSGIALRDRDDHFWGAALFLEPITVATTTPPAAATSRS